MASSFDKTITKSPASTRRYRKRHQRLRRLLVVAGGGEGAPGALDDHSGGPVARVHALRDVLVLHELGKEAPDEGVTRPYRNVL